MQEKVLLIDDDLRTLKSLARFLRMQGYQVAEACDGGEAVELLKRDHFHLVLSDVLMPFVSGVQLLDHVRSFDATIPVLLMSGFAGIDRTQAIKRGATDLIEKPVDANELVSKLKLLLEY